MKEPVHLLNTGCFLIAGYQNQMTCQSLNEILSNQKVDIIIKNFSPNTHQKGVDLVIYANNQSILEFRFNYLEEFYGYSDKWENVNLQLFHQEEMIDMAGLIAIPYGFFTLYDKHNEFLIKSSTLSCTIDNQTIAIDRNFNNFNEFLKSNLIDFSALNQ